MKKIKPRGESTDIILALIDLGLRPLIVAAAMGITTQYVYTVLKKDGRTKGDGRSKDSEIIRLRPAPEDFYLTLGDVPAVLERVFFDWRYASRSLHVLACMRETSIAKTLTATTLPKPRRGRPPGSKNATKPISRSSDGKVVSFAKGRLKRITADQSSQRSSVGVRATG